MECKKGISINIIENKGHQIKRYEKKTMISIVNKNQFNLSWFLFVDNMIYFLKITQRNLIKIKWKD